MTKAVFFTAPMAPIALVAFGLATFAGLPAAHAQSADGACPPGSWFCPEGSQEPSGPPPADKKPLEPLPDPDAQPEAPPPPARRPLPPPPPVVVYSPGPPPDGPFYGPPEGPPPDGPPAYTYRPRPIRPISPPREWGLNLHLDGATVGHGTGSQGAGMAGAGGAVRFKPNRRFGIEADLDFLGGTDYQGNHRTETGFTLNGLVYLNPLSRAQVYLLGGFGWSGAHVTCDSGAGCATPGLDAQYSYFGGQLGIGLEIRLSRMFALNGDVRGFLRTRTDAGANSQPEFVNANGQTTNASGGALFTAGATLYF
ncbi:MAG TPA: outer membrane beta-barrel protein [Polyangiaceae bacterium]|nr:outer membrane beta-barrel protein [Polyangiaceae bacterium]